MSTQKTTYQDHSIFQGRKEYFDEYGDEWCQEDEEGSIVFRRLENGAWVCQGRIIKRGRGQSIMFAHQAFLNSIGEGE